MIKILTYYYNNNYGSLLQACCLRNFIQKNFDVKVVFLNYLPLKLIFYEFYRPLITKKLFNFISAIKKNYKLRKWKKQKKLDSPVPFFKEINKGITIFGSDEVWNFTNKYYGYNSYFFGKHTKGIKIAFSVSIGNANINKLEKKNLSEIKILLKSFRNISARDYSSKIFLKAATEKNYKLTIDPTLLDDSTNIINPKKVSTLFKRNYILIYGSEFTKNIIDKIINFARQKDMKIYSVGYNISWADKNFTDANPDEFIDLMYNSRIVFTSMFHGIILSLRLNKNFWYFVDSQNSVRRDKIKFVVDFFGIKRRSLSKNLDYNETLDYTLINNKINKARIISKNYLLKAISGSLLSMNIDNYK
jgi:hypothetical protein